MTFVKMQTLQAVDLWNLGIDLLSKHFLQDRRSKKDVENSEEKESRRVGGVEISKNKGRLGRNHHLSPGTKFTCSKTKAEEAQGACTVTPGPLWLVSWTEYLLY